MSGAAAGREALALYAGASAAARVHVRVRWHSCPFRAIAEEVPRAGRILEVGCGHGLLAAFLALESRARTVRGIDVARQGLPQTTLEAVAPTSTSPASSQVSCLPAPGVPSSSSRSQRSGRCWNAAPAGWLRAGSWR